VIARRDLHRTDGLKERLNEVVGHFRSICDAARAVRRSEGAVRKWLRGEAEPGAADLRRLSELTGRSVQWMLFGTEE
jgi:hypothetical protein